MSQIRLREHPIGCAVPLVAALLLGSPSAAWPQEAEPITPEVKTALDRISADSLRGHLSFLASDLLEGRGTPSRGLDLAALYIAAQFRRAALETIGDDGYFQTADWAIEEPGTDDFDIVFHRRDHDVPVPITSISLQDALHPLDLRRAAVVKLDADSGWADDRQGGDGLKDKVILLVESPKAGVSPQEQRKARFARNRLRQKLYEEKAVLLICVDRQSGLGSGLAQSRSMVPFSPDGTAPVAVRITRTPELVVHDPELIKHLESLPIGETALAVSVHIAAPVRKTTKVRNVIGLLRGADPRLRETYVLVTAHYDHLGLSNAQGEDKTFNGANDDGSGTVSVIELASALATIPTRPRRSLIFMTFFGEERGLLGSRYYVRHPVVPLDQTVADVNLEQLGRTDASEGVQQSSASLTGFDYSSLGPLFARAGQSVGVRVSKNNRFSDRYFRASDNFSFAQRGIPAATVCVAYQYPDYHGLGDHWEKVDFANMARIDRMLALGLLMLANDQDRPTWNTSNARAATYARAGTRSGEAPGGRAPIPASE
jgi:hypothetical protein